MSTARARSTPTTGWRFGTAAEKEFKAVLIVHLALLWVGEDFIGLGDLCLGKLAGLLESSFGRVLAFKFFGGVGVVFVFVGMPLQGCFPSKEVLAECFQGRLDL